MKRNRLLLPAPVLALAVLCLLAVLGGGVRAQGIGVQGMALEFKNAVGLEPSAVEPIGDGTNLLVADDKTQALLIVNARTREVTRLKQPIQRANSSPKWEALAKDRRNNYYLIGVYAGLFRFHLKDEAEKDPAKIEIEGEVEQLTLNQPAGPNCAPSIPADPNYCGLPVIEGLAVWVNESKEEELVVGTRDDASDFIRVSRAKLTADKRLTLKPFFQFAAPKVETNEKVKWHLSSIEYVPDWGGFLVVTSTEDCLNKFYGNMLWFVSNEALKGSQQKQNPPACGEVVTPIKSEVFEPAMKAEGLAVLPTTDKAKLRVVIVFDNDYARRGSTRDAAALAFAELSKPFQTKTPSAKNLQPSTRALKTR